MRQTVQPSRSGLGTPAIYTAGVMVQLITLPLHMLHTETSHHICAQHCESCITQCNQIMCQAAVDHVSNTDPMSSAHVSRNRFNKCHVSGQQLLLKSARVLHVTSIDIKASSFKQNEVWSIGKWPCFSSAT